MGDYYGSPDISQNPDSAARHSDIHLPPVTPVAPMPPMVAPQHVYNKSHFSSNLKEILKRALKYLIEGLAVALVAYFVVAKGKLNIKEVVYLGITAAFVFAILDTFSPTVSLGVRFGAGFGIGQGLFGLNPTTIGAVIV